MDISSNVKKLVGEYAQQAADQKNLEPAKPQQTKPVQKDEFVGSPQIQKTQKEYEKKLKEATESIEKLQKKLLVEATNNNDEEKKRLQKELAETQIKLNLLKELNEAKVELQKALLPLLQKQQRELALTSLGEIAKTLEPLILRTNAKKIGLIYDQEEVDKVQKETKEKLKDLLKLLSLSSPEITKAIVPEINKTIDEKNPELLVELSNMLREVVRTEKKK